VEVERVRTSCSFSSIDDIGMGYIFMEDIYHLLVKVTHNIL